MNEYDIIIVGSGPAGLALAQCLSNTNKKILLLEKYNVIGGLHRVLRVPYGGEELFTEHSPRVYSNIYLNFINLLNEMDYKFEDLFTPYNFSFIEIGGKTIFSVITFKEVFNLGIQFFKLLFNNNAGKNISIGDFMRNKNFSFKTYDMIDRVTRLTDGASADRYTLNQFLQLANQQALYKLYQPKIPNDKGLFRIWYDFLINKGVNIKVNTTLNKINLNINENLVESIQIDNNEIIKCKQLFLAMPPTSFTEIFKNCSTNIQNTFIPFNELLEYSNQTEYNIYISSIFHWDQEIKLPKIYGFPYSSWGIVFIVLSDYMCFKEKTSRTVISCAITISDRISPNINKTANQCNKDEILKETFRQLREAYPQLSEPTISLLSPELYYSDNSWKTNGKAFINCNINKSLPFTGKISNLYNVGTHNGKCKYAFTSLETAVTNAIYLSRIVEPSLKKKYTIKTFTTISDVLRYIVLILILIIIYMIILFIIKRNERREK